MAFGFIYFVFPVESITTGLNVLAFITIIVFVPFLPGNNIGALLEPGGIDMNFVVFEIVKGETTPAIVLLSSTKVTVCGSPTVVGLDHVTLCPDLISIFLG